MAYRIGVDVGGTFTDLVLAGRHGRLVLDKRPTTPHDQAEGVLGGIALLAAREGLSREALLAATDLVVHGTTTADNTMIEMSGATTGLITSEGHRDEIEIRRGYKEDIWDPAQPPPPPICPRRRRYGVPERLDFEGSVIAPLDEEAVRRACRRLRRQGVESLAVVLLFSFVNPAHERRVRALAAEELPGVMVSLSHEVMPSAPEFERTSTTLVNAYVGPKIGRYLGRLDERLRVGPESAGAEPGRVCYGRGGAEPTVTDANLVLGYLNPGSFCGGTMRLDVEGAHAAIRERVAKPLGISVVEAAEGIFRLVNANMAHAVRKVSAGPGGRPRPPPPVVLRRHRPAAAGRAAPALRPTPIP